MSSDKKTKDNGSKKDQFRPRNFGATGFAKFEYNEHDPNNANKFLRHRDQWIAYVSVNFNSRLECIVKDGVMPVKVNHIIL